MQNSLTFDLEVGQPLNVRLHLRQSVEGFYGQLLTAVNLSLVGGPFQKIQDG